MAKHEAVERREGAGNGEGTVRGSRQAKGRRDGWQS